MNCYKKPLKIIDDTIKLYQNMPYLASHDRSTSIDALRLVRQHVLTAKEEEDKEFYAEAPSLDWDADALTWDDLGKVSLTRN